MERNHNEQQVILSLEMYNTLLAMAADSPRYTTKRIEKHVRKFNPYLQLPHQLRVKEFEAYRSKEIREARAFFNKHVGQTVYALVNMGSSRVEGENVFCPVVVKRLDKDRRFIRVAEVSDITLGLKCTVRVSASSLALEIPDDFIDGVGAYRRYRIRENGPFDIRKKEAEAQEKRLLDSQTHVQSEMCDEDIRVEVRD
ncbi:hypothetical protein AVT69_gp251 [Pseudomonas phage PhiPA3]|uniref:Uncharacterized protein 253 n=1 Tax=Pseudomonas phage PhiPA3 TaxID=998086 RepID=F8SJ94_BPPA3|nr:hypothetical protein AVT69_gp251 [Pseudomonas phage PhiPA3]AEH03676.1 hypothetical protein [Pseudomonas phage PhiPA3]